MWMFDDYTLNSLVRKYILDLLEKILKLLKKLKYMKTQEKFIIIILLKKFFITFFYYFLNYKYQHKKGKFDLKFNRYQEFNKLILEKLNYF